MKELIEEKHKVIENTKMTPQWRKEYLDKR